MDTFEFLKTLESISALKFGSFTLASGEKSPFYLDLRILPYHPKLFQELITSLAEKITKTSKFDIICGVPMAGIPFATLLANYTRKPLILIRKEAKKHGLGNIVEGGSVRNKRVLLVDDLISSGHSKESFIDNLRNEGAIIEHLAVIVDRRDKNSLNIKEWENKMKVSVISLFKLSKKLILEIKTTKGLD